MREFSIQTQAKNKRYWIVVLGLGLFSGVLNFFSPGSLFIFFLAMFLIFAIRLFAGQDERAFLARLFIFGITLRIILSLAIKFILMLQGKWMYFSEGARLATPFGDAGFNTIVGWWTAQYVSGEPLSDYLLRVVDLGIGEYGWSGYLYIVSLFHCLFGFSPVSVVFINCIISASTGIIYYFIAKKIAGVNAARITAIFIIFFPSLIIWSSTNLKEPLFIFLTGVILWQFLQLLEKNKIKIRYLILIILALMLQFTIRRWILWPTLLTLGICYLVMKQKLKIMHILLCVIVLLNISPIFQDKLDEIKGKVINYHYGVISTGGHFYRIYDDWVYQLEIPNTAVPYSQVFKGYLKGWLHFFLEPFPWHISSKLSLISYPQMLIWYFLIPFSALGVLLQLRYNSNKSLVLVVYFLIIGSVLALTGGNIGTVFRHRDVLTPLFLTFASLGLVKTFGRLNILKR